MLVHANKQELLKLAKSIYNVSRTLLSVYDANGEYVCSYPDRMCRFCREIRKSPYLTQRCIECDTAALEKCAQTRMVYPYKCHMGLTEVATPIIRDEMVIGYILFGQITDNRDKTALYSGLSELSEKHILNAEALREGVEKIKYRSPEYISSVSDILEMCAGYIWQNNFIGIKNNSVAHSIDLYIKDNISSDLSVGKLCSYFHISRSALYSVSKEFFGCGISEYVALCRISRAKELLCEHSVTQVSAMVGIDDTNYFIRFFKKHTGITPKQYQLANKYKS